MAKEKKTVKKPVKTTAKKAVKKIIKKRVAKKKKIVLIPKKDIKRKDDLIVVHSPVNPTQEFVVASEWADDEAIEAELMGKAMEHYVYEFEQKGKKITGMTVVGVNETCRLLTRKKSSGIKIRIVPDTIKIERDVTMGGEKGVSVILFAENMLSGETAIGAKFEPYQKVGQRGKYENTFALEKAVSKAERNAKRKLIPERLAVETINKFIKQGKVQQLNAPVQQRAIVEPVKNEVNYLGKLVTLLAKEANVKMEKGNITKENLEILIEIYNSYTGNNIKSLKIEQSTAQKYLMDFINSPIILGK